MPTILVVEDEPVLLKSVLTNLSKQYECWGANSVDSALVEYHRHPQIDIVILDFILENVLSDKILQEIRKINPEQKIIITSGYEVELDISHKHHLSFLQKPYSIPALFDSIKDILTSY